MDPVTLPLAYIQAHQARFVGELTDLVRFPSVSAQPRHQADLHSCARWLVRHLETIGLEHARLIQTAGHPLVSADWLHAPGRPTLLIYGHYDVQPADPRDGWTAPPFQPRIRGAYLYGRGSSDDKGQFFAHLKALEAYLRTSGALPVNVKVLLEGEEEIGSGSLIKLAGCRGELFAADAVVVSDTTIPTPHQPAITISLRGMLSLEIQVQGPARDLHSGNFGGAVHNPLQVLCELLAGLHDREGRIAVPGLYQRVRCLPPSERVRMARTGPSDAAILQAAGVPQGWGEHAYSLYERITIRPALTIHGIVGGYQGRGHKSVIPARATAKLSLRLVPSQDPLEIHHLLRQHLRRQTPPSVHCQIRMVACARPVVTQPDQRILEAAQVAYTRAFGRQPLRLRSGGTIPIVNLLQEKLRIPPVLMGFALPSDGMHGPDEKFYLPNFFHGIQTSLHFLAAVGRRAA